MERFSMTRSPGVLWLDGLLLLFSVSAASGLLDPVNQLFRIVMAQASLSATYVLVVALLGTLLPLAARFVRSLCRAVREMLNPFLWFLAGQLLCEVTVVLLGAKGLAVLVGLVFSLLRLLQVRLLWPIAASIGWLQGLLPLQAGMWGVNPLQIGVNRIWPLLSGP
jgi:hypothetical protein